jgi:hypothetical protein
VKVLRNLAPFFSLILGKWGSLWCGGQFHYHDTWRFDCVQALAVTATTVHWAASLAVLIESLI